MRTNSTWIDTALTHEESLRLGRIVSLAKELARQTESSWEDRVPEATRMVDEEAYEP